MINQFLLGAFSYLLGALVIFAGVIVTVICTTCSDLIKEEAATRLERLPLWLLERAAGRLPLDCRDQILQSEWKPELLEISRFSEGMPITRLIRGVRFAVDLLGGPATTIGLALQPTRKNEQPARSAAQHSQPAIDWITSGPTLSDGIISPGLIEAYEYLDRVKRGHNPHYDAPEWYRNGANRSLVEAILAARSGPRTVTVGETYTG